MALLQRTVLLALVAILLATPGRADDMAPLRALAQREATGGNAGAAAMLKLLGGQRDRDTAATAMRWLQEAAERGHPEAQFQLGFQFETAPAPDFRRAMEWYLKAAAQGNTLAESNIATLYLFGRGVKRDPKKAAEWSLKAAEKGNAVSQTRLGIMHFLGDGVEQDALRAEYWLEKAAQQGNVQAQARLGAMLALGQAGAAVNKDKGVFWLRKAADSGLPEAKKLLKHLEDGTLPAAGNAGKAP